MSLLTLACLLVQDPVVIERVIPPSGGLVQPTDIVAIPGDDRLFVVERAGTVRIVRSGALEPEPFLDVSARVDTLGDVGLRSMTFHPQHDLNGYVYVWYDENNGTNGVDGVLARLSLEAGETNRVDGSTFTEILRVPQDGRSHGGGALRFGPDGMMYLGIGDGTPGGDPFCRAQDTSDLQGTMIRIDVDAGSPYAVPADNPYVGTPGVRPEIIHHGLRHPWKWCFDEFTGDMWIADVGQVEREEVDFVPAGSFGLNFGWSVTEGHSCFAAPCSGQGTDCASPAFTGPIAEYEHDDGCSITGGHVYRGSDVPDLSGAYVYADFCSHKFWTLRQSGGVAVQLIERDLEVYPQGAHLILPSTFGVDGFGEMYVADYQDGELYRLAPATAVIEVCDGDPNAVGDGADLRIVGTPSIQRNSLAAQITGAPPFTLGVLFYGPEITNFPGGNGTRCVSGGSLALFRAGATVANGSGALLHPISFTSAPFNYGAATIHPGSTWIFQTWYRDIGGPLGASTNFSDAVSVRFRP